MKSLPSQPILTLGLFAAATILHQPAADAAAPANIPQQRSCQSLLVEAPGPSFPASSSDPIRITIKDTANKPFHDYPEPEVFRETTEGWAPVDYELQDPGEDRLARDLVLLQREEGFHIVTWASECGGDTSPIDSTQTVEGRFELMPEAALPAELGEFTIEGKAVAGVAPTWLAEYSIELDESWRPWHSSMRFGLGIDDRVISRPSNTMGFRDGDVLSRSFVYSCAEKSLSNGEHEAYLWVSVSGEDFRSEAVPIDVECLPPEENGGCTVAGLGSGSWLPLALVGAIAVRRRRDRPVA